jgi:hypothetical protein
MRRRARSAASAAIRSPWPLALALGGCGWGYAQQIEEETRPPPRPVAASAAEAPPPVLATTPPAPMPAAGAGEVVADARDLPTLERNHRFSRTAATPADMARHAFRVRLVDGLNDATQWVHCTSGRILRFDKRTPEPGLLEARTRAGIPPGVWVLEVDPAGLRADLPNNDWYRHIAKFHRLEFIDRNRADGTVIYRYIGPRDASDGRHGS